MTNFPKKPIGEATRAELHAYATKVLGLEIGKNASPDSIKARIRAAQGEQDYILLVDGAPEESVRAVADSTRVERATRHLGPGKDGGTPASRDPKVRLLLAKTESPGGSEPVSVLVNGVRMDIPRGEVVEIPYRYFLVLQNAIRRIYVSHEVDGKIVTEPQDAPAYGYQVFAMPSPEEIAEWHRRVASENTAGGVRSAA